MRRLVGGLFIACLGYSADMQRFVSDPLYVNQWYLAPYGIHINIGNTWDFVTGRGINIGIVDDGLDLTHEDLAPNVHPKAVSTAAGTHGTQCAGLAAAAGFNEVGMIGVAPEARLMGQPEAVLTHVAIHCWGRLDDGKDSGRMGPLQQADMEEAATKGRDGFGTVQVIPAGDGRALGDDSSYDEFASSRFAIAVGAVNRDGQQSSYSESGMNLAISAPGGEPLAPASLWTTTAGGSYTEEFYGTAAAIATSRRF
jgi:subtilisin family serine protease